MFLPFAGKMHIFAAVGYTTASTERAKCFLPCMLGGSILKVIDKIALVLVIVGALNWGSVGLFGFDCVAFLFGGQMSTLSRIIYALVGVAGVWSITLLFRDTDAH